MRNPFRAARRTATSSRGVPAPHVLPAVEYLDAHPLRERGPRAPEVSIQGIDPRIETRPVMPALHLAARSSQGSTPIGELPRGTPDTVTDDHGDGVDSVADLLAAPPGRYALRRLSLDARSFRDVLEARGGWNVLAQLVRDPADACVNAVLRAAVGRPNGVPEGLLEVGDVDCDVRIVRDGDSVAGRCQVDLGRARLTLTPLFTDSERLTRRLAETLARPRDRAVRRCLEQALGLELLDLPLSALVATHADAPQCAVPGAWTTPAVAAP